MSAKTRRRLSASQEDYLEAVWALIWEEGVARVSEIAGRLGVSMPSVTGALKALARRQLVEYTPHRYVTLSNRGMELAERISARHGMLRRFLTDVLGIDGEPADRNACRIEHAVDEDVSRKLTCFVKFISQGRPARQWAEEFRAFCARQETPDPTPAAGDGRGTAEDRKHNRPATLADVEPGGNARIVRLTGPATSIRRLAAVGITRDAVVSVVRVAPLGDPVEVKTPDGKLSVRKAEAQSIEVERLT